MITSPNAHEVMHYFEACKLRSYPDPASPMFRAMRRAGVDPYNLRSIPAPFASLSGAPWTRGWGETGPHVKPGQMITQEQADKDFARRLQREFEPAVEAMLTRTPTQGQFDGIVCWAYNVGVNAAAGSTLVRMFNAGDPAFIDQFLRWDLAGGSSLLGLRRRRAAERALAMGKTGSEAIAIGAAVQ